MRALDLRIPPPAVAVVAALLMWLVARWTPTWRLHIPSRVVVAVIIAVVGALICADGILEFRRARTTINPMKPSTSSSLVTAGIYRFSRNPMYLGLAIMLLGGAVFLSNPVSLLVLAGFVYYIDRFQIVPEEKALDAIFRAAFQDYRRNVRRWL